MSPIPNAYHPNRLSLSPSPSPPSLPLPDNQVCYSKHSVNQNAYIRTPQLIDENCNEHRNLDCNPRQFQSPLLRRLEAQRPAPASGLGGGSGVMPQWLTSTTPAQSPPVSITALQQLGLDNTDTDYSTTQFQYLNLPHFAVSHISFPESASTSKRSFPLMKVNSHNKRC